jgi:hypothetical protein
MAPLDPEPPHEADRTGHVGQDVETQTQDPEAPGQQPRRHRERAGGNALDDGQVGQRQRSGQELLPGTITTIVIAIAIVIVGATGRRHDKSLAGRA